MFVVFKSVTDEGEISESVCKGRSELGNAWGEGRDMGEMVAEGLEGHTVE